MARPLILLDLDDTLLYQEPVNRRLLAELGQAALPELDPTEFVSVFSAIAVDLWEALPTFSWTRKIGISWGEGLWGDFEGDEPRLRELKPLARHYRILAWQETLERLGGGCSSRRAESWAEEFARRRKETMVLVEGALDLLGWLRPRFALGLITNGAPDLQRFKIQRSGLGAWFDSITISGDHGVGKPDPALFRIAMKAFEGAPRCLVIGNSPSSDIQGAANAGLPAIWFDQGEAPLTQHLRPLARVQALGEIPPILVREGWTEA